MISVHDDISTTLTISSCVIGAGFVGGRELIMLLGSSNAILSGIIFGILYGVLIYGIMRYCNTNNIATTAQWSVSIAGKYHHVVTALLLLCYLTMTATMLATINQTMCYVLYINTNMPIYSCAIAIAVGIFIYEGARGLRLLCSISLPIIILVIIICTTINNNSIQLSNTMPNIGQCALYAIFNGVMSLGVVIPLCKTHNRARVSISIGTILASLIAIILAVMDHYPTNSYTIPLLSLANNSIDITLYTVCLLLSATVSVATNCYTLSHWLDNILHNKIASIIIIVTISILLSLCGLQLILAIMYPMVCVIGIVMLLLCITRQRAH